MTLQQGGQEPWRRRVALVLVVIASVAGMGGVIGVWARATLLDTDRFVRVVGPTLESDEFYVALGLWAGDEVVEALALEERVAKRLAEVDDLLVAFLIRTLEPGDRLLAILENLSRPGLDTLAPAIAGPVEERVRSAVYDTINSDAVVDNLPQVVARAHRGLVALATDDLDQLPNVYVADGEVRVDLIPVLARVLAPVGEAIEDALPDISLPPVLSDRVDEAIAQLREALGESVPDDFGQLTVMSKEGLETLQSTARQADRIIWTWVLSTFLVAAAAIYLSANRRRTLIQLASGFAISLVLAALVLGYFESVVVAAFTGHDGAVIGSFLGDVFSGLRIAVVVLTIIATAVALSASTALRPSKADR